MLRRKTAVRLLSQAEDLGGPKLAGIQITFCPVVCLFLKAKASTVIDVRAVVLKFCRLGPAQGTKLVPAPGAQGASGSKRDVACLSQPHRKGWNWTPLGQPSF